MRKSERLIIKILPDQKAALEAIARAEGEPVAVVMRRLIRVEAAQRGVLPAEPTRAPADQPEAPDAEG